MYLNICQILDQINPKRLSNLNPRELELLQFQILEVWSFLSRVLAKALNLVFFFFPGLTKI